MRAFKTLLGQESILVKLYQTSEEVAKFCRTNYDIVLGLDIETAKLYEPLPKKCPQPGLDPRMSKIRLLQIYDNAAVHVFNLWELEDIVLSRLRDFLVDHKFSAHYGMFERGHLYNLFKIDIDISCTIVLAQMVERALVPAFEYDEEDDKASRGFGLAAVSKKYLGLDIDKTLQDSDWGAKQLTDQQIVYASLDAVLTKRLYDILHSKVVELGMEKAWKVTKACAKVVREMQWEGMQVDEVAHDALMAEWELETSATSRVLEEVMPRINPNSGKQLGEWLEKNASLTILQSWPRTSKGAYSFSNKALQEFRSSTAINALCEHKTIAKKISSFGLSLREATHPLTGRIHAQYNEAATASGRFSCSNPNLQNQPREKKFRAIFVPAEGAKLIICDFNAIEPRVQGELSRDKNLLEAFKTGADLYKALASKPLHKPVEQIDDTERKIYKAAVLGLSYGMGPAKLQAYIYGASKLKVSLEECQQIWTDYHTKMVPEYSLWCRQQRAVCERRGYAVTVLGRRRKLNEGDLYTCAVNHPIQGTSSEAMKAAMVYTQKYLEGRGKIIASVHDEIVVEAPESEAEFCRVQVDRGMLAGFKYLFPEGITTGLVESKICNNWSEK